jgi:hypothetical protein
MDLNQPLARPNNCPECGASFPQTAIRCWLCGWKVGDPVGIRAPKAGSGEVNPYAPPAPPVPPRGENLKWTYSLSTLFLWMTLISVVLGVWKMAPGLGIVLGVLSFPAALHTMGLAAYRKRRTGDSMSVADKIGAFAASFAFFVLVAIAVIIAAIGALFAICLAGSNHPVSDGRAALVWFAGGAAILSGIVFLAYRLVRSLWRKKD